MFLFQISQPKLLPNLFLLPVLLVRRQPFLPYALILSRQDIGTLAAHDREVCTSFPMRSFILYLLLLLRHEQAQRVLVQQLFIKPHKEMNALQFKKSKRCRY